MLLEPECALRRGPAWVGRAASRTAPQVGWSGPRPRLLPFVTQGLAQPPAHAGSSMSICGTTSSEGKSLEASSSGPLALHSAPSNHAWQPQDKTYWEPEWIRRKDAGFLPASTFNQMKREERDPTRKEKTTQDTMAEHKMRREK